MEKEIDMELVRRFLPKPSMSMKDAMIAFANGQRIEYRVCIPGLPESENPWYLIDESKPQFDEDWDYRLYVDREQALKLCEQYKILNMKNVAKIKDNNALKDLAKVLDSFMKEHHINSEEL